MMRQGLWVVLVLLIAGAQARAVVYTDTEFAEANWSSQQLTLPGITDPGANYSAGQAVSGGNGGAYRAVTQTYTGPNLGIMVAHLASGETYTPGVSGALAHVSFSFELNFFNYPGACCNPSYAVGYDPIVSQNGDIYLGPQTLSVSASWVGFNLLDLGETSFTLVNTPGVHPDFSASGGVITFGYVTFNGTAGSQTTSTTSGLDNWSVSTVAQAVPEPAMTWITAALGLGWLRRYTRRTP